MTFINIETNILKIINEVQCCKINWRMQKCLNISVHNIYYKRRLKLVLKAEVTTLKYGRGRWQTSPGNNLSYEKHAGSIPAEVRATKTSDVFQFVTSVTRVFFGRSWGCIWSRWVVAGCNKKLSALYNETEEGVLDSRSHSNSNFTTIYYSLKFRCKSNVL